MRRWQQLTATVAAAGVVTAISVAFGLSPEVTFVLALVFGFAAVWWAA